MRLDLHGLLRWFSRGLLPLLLASLSGLSFAAPTYRAHVVAPPMRDGGGLEFIWYTALDTNNEGTTLLSLFQYGNPGVAFVTHDKSGRYLRHLGGFSRNGGSLRHAINDTGDVAGHRFSAQYWVGEVLKDGGFGAEIRGFPEGDYGGYFSSAYAFGLSNAGHVVGQAEGDLDGRWRGYVWQGGVMQEIDSFGGPSSTALAVNDKGQAVGHGDLAYGSRHAFSFRAGVLRDLGTLGGTSSWAVDVNQSGQIVGTAQQADGGERAFLYAKRQMSTLPTPEGASAGAASINRRGQVVGHYTLAGQAHPFLFDDGLVHRLQDLLTQRDQAVWTIVNVVTINDKGWILVDALKAGDQHSTVLLLKPKP